MLSPIKPMEPVRSDTVPTGDPWVATVKWDGVRVLCYHDSDGTALYNRHLRSRTQHYPELLDLHAYCDAKSIVLDGEVIALGRDGKPSFHEVMRRDGIRRMDRVERVMATVPVHYMVFDILYLNGEWLVDQPFSTRIAALRSTLKPSLMVQPVLPEGDGQALFDIVGQHDMEGIVVKQTDSPYIIGGKTSYWRKIKHYKDLIAAIGGYTVAREKVNAVLLGLYDEANRFHYIGHAGSGKLPAAQWRALSRVLQVSGREHNPFVQRPPRIQDAVWVDPKVSVKVKFMEWTSGATLRQPTLQVIVDEEPGSCRF